MNKKLILITLILITAGLGFYYKTLKTNNSHKAIELSSFPEGGELNLKTKNGFFKLSDYREKVVIIYFGYTFCPDICPTTLATIGATLKKLSEDKANQIQPVFISVDPKRDTLDKLEEYSKFFHPSIIAATDEPSKVKRAANKYGVNYEKHFPQKGDPFYVIDHSTQAFIVDKKGVLVDLIPHGSRPEEIISKLNKHLD